MKDFKDKIAVVTGAGSGIGRAASLKFAENGMDIAIADVDIEGGEETARGVRDLGRKAIVVRTDVSDRTSVEALADAVVRDLGIPSLIFNNAGVATFKNIVDMTSDDWSWVMGVNLFLFPKIDCMNVAWQLQQSSIGRSIYVRNTVCIASKQR